MDFAVLLQKAHAAAAAAAALIPDRPNSFDCGFAWVTIDGKSPLANYCRAEIKKAGGERRACADLGGKGYPRGWQFWCPGRDGRQSVAIHEAGAQAFRAVLAEAGIVASVGSRLD
jgi:hypothetical protein